MKSFKKRKTLSILIAIVFVLFAAYCFSPTSETEDSDKQPTYTEIVEDISQDEETEDVTVVPAVSDIDIAEDNVSSLEDEETPDPVQIVPAYSNEAYTAINDNVPFFTEEELLKAASSYESYSELDSLGRCGVCIASIGKDIMPTEERGNIGQVKPTGWQTVKYNGIIDGNYLYNRCHLIGYQLAGENSNEKNLITGTRYMNMDGMLPFENMVADYVESTGNHVLYRVTPVFEGDNLVASGVTIEAESVEDHGAGLLFNVYVYNVQPGVNIDYASGKSELDGTVSAQEVEETPQPTAEGTSYVLNTNTKKFHYTWCSSVDEMKAKNREDFTGSRDDVIARGFVPCKRCKP